MTESDPRSRRAVAALESTSRRVVATGIEVADEGDRWLGVVLGEARAAGWRLQGRLSTAVDVAVRRVAPHRADGPRGRRLRAARWILDEARRTGIVVEPEAAAVLADKLTILLELVLAGEIDVGHIAFERADPPPHTAAYSDFVAVDMDGPLTAAAEGE